MPSTWDLFGTEHSEKMPCNSLMFIVFLSRIQAKFEGNTKKNMCFSCQMWSFAQKCPIETNSGISEASLAWQMPKKSPRRVPLDQGLSENGTEGLMIYHSVLKRGNEKSPTNTYKWKIFQLATSHVWLPEVLLWTAGSLGFTGKETRLFDRWVYLARPISRKSLQLKASNGNLFHLQCSSNTLVTGGFHPIVHHVPKCPVEVSHVLVESPKVRVQAQCRYLHPSLDAKFYVG
jgi:hypothetical protein